MGTGWNLILLGSLPKAPQLHPLNINREEQNVITKEIICDYIAMHIKGLSVGEG